MAEHGGKRGKKRAVVAVARKLAVLSRTIPCLVADRVSCVLIIGLTSLADLPSDFEGGLTRTFEVFHEYPLKFESYLLSCAKMLGAKESDPD